MNDKMCSACREIKDVSNFNKNRSARDGLCNYCKACEREGRRMNNPNLFFDRTDFVISTISSVAFEVGETIPSDRDMADITGFSRNTIREALSILKYLGYISCEHGKKTILIKEIEFPLTNLRSDH